MSSDTQQLSLVRNLPGVFRPLQLGTITPYEAERLAPYVPLMLSIPLDLYVL